MAFTPIRRQQMQIPMGEVINWADPLAQGIVGYVVHGKTSPGPNSITGTVGNSVSKGGKGYGFGSTYAGATNGYVSLGTVPTIGYGPSKRKIRSLFFHVLYAGTGGGAFGRILDHTNPNTAESLWMLTDQKLAYQFYSLNDAATINILISDVGVGFGERKLGVTLDNERGIWAAYIDGVKSGEVYIGRTNCGMYPPSGNMVTGNRPSDVARTWDGIIYLGLVYDRLLTDQDHAQLAANPARVLI